MYKPHFLYPFINIHFCSLKILAIVNNAGMDMEGHICPSDLDFIHSGHIPRKEITKLCSVFFNFLRNCHPFTHDGSTNLCSWQQGPRLPFTPYPWQHLFCLAVLIITIANGMKWDPVVLLNCFSLIISDGDEAGGKRTGHNLKEWHICWGYDINWVEPTSHKMVDDSTLGGPLASLYVHIVTHQLVTHLPDRMVMSQVSPWYGPPKWGPLALRRKESKSEL